MDHSFPVTEWKPQASAGKHSQVAELAPELDGPSEPLMLALAILDRCTFNGTLNESVRCCGLEDQKIAELIHISPGYMSRFLRGVGQQWARRLVAFMRVTNSRAPLQWIAHQVGCEVVPADRRAAEVAGLKARLMELEGKYA
jgi:DNA-binding transcriptional regulator YdaS (Cro superfamily)